jgi:hypothetical protein
MVPAASTVAIRKTATLQRHYQPLTYAHDTYLPSHDVPSPAPLSAIQKPTSLLQPRSLPQSPFSELMNPHFTDDIMPPSERLPLPSITLGGDGTASLLGRLPLSLEGNESDSSFFN